MKDRRNKCKCGKFIAWNIDDKKVKCKHCGTEYTIEDDSILVYWLEEIITTPQLQPYRTEPR